VLSSEGDDLGAIIKQTSGDKRFVFQTYRRGKGERQRRGNKGRKERETERKRQRDRKRGWHTSCGRAIGKGTFTNNGTD
jgi:hypothetical protein